MDDKKRDLIPVAAIALFLVIIIALCAVRLHQRRETRAEIAETESTQIWYSEEPAESAESETKDAADQTEETTGEKKQTAERGQQEDEALTEHPDSKLPAGKGKESQGAKQEGNPPDGERKRSVIRRGECEQDKRRDASGDVRLLGTG